MISERECKLYDEGLNSKVKLSLYGTFSKKEKYLHGVSDAESSSYIFSVQVMDTWVE